MSYEHNACFIYFRTRVINNLYIIIIAYVLYIFTHSYVLNHKLLIMLLISFELYMDTVEEMKEKIEHEKENRKIERFRGRKEKGTRNKRSI